tara:strand:- start:214 stop:414 length:201 start_codon:yes stop_codon:yes gene_type:complete
MSTIEKLIKGLQIALKYGATNEVAVEHEIIYVCPDIDSMEAEDVKALQDAGWHEVPDFECWGPLCN